AQNVPLHSVPRDTQFVAFSAQTRMSGIDLPSGLAIRKGAPDAVIKFVEKQKGIVPAELKDLVNIVATKGATPLVVAEGPQVVGLVVLEDIVKGGTKERLERLRKAGVRTVMITGDNPLTAA